MVVTWGSQNGVPYVAGTSSSGRSSWCTPPHELAKHAVIDPFVDFTSLDVVGVVVPRQTQGGPPRDQRSYGGNDEPLAHLDSSPSSSSLAVTSADSGVQPVPRSTAGSRPRPHRGGGRAIARGPAVRRHGRLPGRHAGPQPRAAGRPRRRPLGARAGASIAVLAGRVRSATPRRSPLAGLATVAVCSFVASLDPPPSAVSCSATTHSRSAEMMQVICIRPALGRRGDPVAAAAAAYPRHAVRSDPTGRIAY